MSEQAVLQVTYNSRDLGGLPADDGGTITPRTVFRSDALAGLTDDGLQSLTDLNIGTVVDLRTDGERARAADRLPTDGSVRFLPLPVQGGAMDEMVQKLLPTNDDTVLSEEQLTAIVDQVPTLEELYLAILAGSAPQFAELARAVIDAAETERPGVLFHCTAGKDRTGLAAALLLLVAGTPREVIVDDYIQTGKNLAGGLAETLTALITSMGVPLTPRLKTLATESPASAIEAAMDWVSSEHGDAAGYLGTGGMSVDELDDLKRVLTTPAR
ncbi:tyrosine-protein phosphatase [Microbacterium sp. CFH 90308]|uniref:Tyrosine-protein phosphatase n=1 Tax=Microbacterium salsuginis TaxID=2722803 RepID=A0ABX1KE19_9MICO|nr:tyrosine-protein phosphatase [Microbacterium sp. CFH 90308]NLP84558.1 tyrosine-protein phosphatase [Microbacterium sp. CFH 90308]